VQERLIGSFPAFNARPKEALDEWLTRIKTALADDPNAAPLRSIRSFISRTSASNTTWRSA
jgi:hypothetical protein